MTPSEARKYMLSCLDHRRYNETIRALKRHFKTTDVGIAGLTGSVSIQDGKTYRFVTDDELMGFVETHQGA